MSGPHVTELRPRRLFPPILLDGLGHVAGLFYLFICFFFRTKEPQHSFRKMSGQEYHLEDCVPGIWDKKGRRKDEKGKGAKCRRRRACSKSCVGMGQRDQTRPDQMFFFFFPLGDEGGGRRGHGSYQSWQDSAFFFSFFSALAHQVGTPDKTCLADQ